MKKTLFTLATLFALIACNKTPKDYLTIGGKLENNNDTLITIAGRSGVVKTIKLNTDGTFKDTLKVANADIYTFQINRIKRVPVFLKNGFNISLKGNSENMLNSLELSGIGAQNTNFILAQIKESQKIGNPTLILQLEEEAFKNRIDGIKKNYDSILSSYKNLDSLLVNMATNQTNQMVNYFNETYNQNKKMAKGLPSPKFENYTDFKGGKKSLDSFKGKYVYIDVWATWCGPCIQQIPYLKNLEKEYHNKNIEFVSISTDESRRNGGSWEAAEKKWRTFVKEKNLTGVQLWSGKDFSFQQAYQINSIPRFILVDPVGNIVNANAPRPSDPELKNLFTSLGL